jgi:hypothetical protein
VAEAFGATVTKANGRVGCVLADAAVPHPASPALSVIKISRLARRTTNGFLFIDYGLDGVTGVLVVVAVGVEVGISVGVSVAVSVGGASVVEVAVSVCEGVSVGNSGMPVIPGVSVGTFGTQSL